LVCQFNDVIYLKCGIVLSKPLFDNHLCLSVILKTLTLTGQEFLEVQEKMEITGSEVRAVGWMIKQLPAELLQESCVA
jgi:hypothetical protein